MVNNILDLQVYFPVLDLWVYFPAPDLQVYFPAPELWVYFPVLDLLETSLFPPINLLLSFKCLQMWIKLLVT